jgi:hypothetical protein
VKIRQGALDKAKADLQRATLVTCATPRKSGSRTCIGRARGS